MKLQLIIALITAVLMGSSSGQQYPNCVSCSGGSMPLSPLSYSTMRSNVFNGTQPSNEGCTNGAIVSGRVTIDCGQGTTLIDCDRGFNGGNYLDLSRTFAWNRTTSVAQQVSIVFRFDQQIKISRITMFFWNSQNNSIIIPSMKMYWGDGSTILTNEITAITTSSPSRTGDGRRRINIDIDNNGLQFQYLRIEMTFNDDIEWIFLGEVQFCGNTAPFHIAQPSTDNDVQIVSPTATMTSITCSLNITIPSTVIVTWSHNASLITDLSQITTAGSTTTLQIENLQPSDAGVYQCVFNDTTGYILRRITSLLIVDLRIIQPPVNLFKVTFNESSSSVQLTCSLNINIPSSVTVWWIYNSSPFIISPPNKVIRSSNTVTLLIGGPRPSDAGPYECFFMGLNLRRIIVLEFQNTSTISPSTFATTTMSTSYLNGATSQPVTESAHHSTSFTVTSTSPDTITTIVTSSVILGSSNTTTAPTSTSATLIIDSPTLSLSSQSDDNNSSSVGVTVAIIVLVVVVLIIITVVVIGIIVVWKRKNSKQHTKPEGVYYSTIDETTLPRSSATKPEEPVYNEMNNGEQENKEPQYMDIPESIHSNKQANKVTMQDNPSYSIPFEHQVKIQDNPAYSTSSDACM